VTRLAVKPALKASLGTPDVRIIEKNGFMLLLFSVFI
jgi:hypothetical protein